MRSFIIVSLFAFLVACSSNEVKTPNPPVIEDSSAGVCVHKYDDELNFQYVGDIVYYQKALFGEEIYFFEYTLTNGQVHVLNEYQVENYDCGKD